MHIQDLYGGHFSGDRHITDGADYLGVAAADYRPISATVDEDATYHGSGVTSNKEAIDDPNTHDSDVSYSQITSSSLPKKLNGNVVLPAGTYNAVQPLVVHRKTDAGPCQFTLEMKSGATTDDNSGELFTPSTIYGYAMRIYAEDFDNPGNPFAGGATVRPGVKRTA